jgi:hypothetical protein
MHGESLYTGSEKKNLGLIELIQLFVFALLSMCTIVPNCPLSVPFFFFFTKTRDSKMKQEWKGEPSLIKRNDNGLSKSENDDLR